MGVRKGASKQGGKKQSKPVIDVVVVMVCDFFSSVRGPNLGVHRAGRTMSLHHYYLTFIVLTYLAYLIAVHTSYISSLGTTDLGIQALIALDWLFREN
jgi:hypothetical protein